MKATTCEVSTRQSLAGAERKQLLTFAINKGLPGPPGEGGEWRNTEFQVIQEQ